MTKCNESGVNILFLLHIFLAMFLSIDFSEDTLKWLADEGYDEKMGARPISRKIQESIKKPMSEALLFGALKKGGIVKLSVNKNKLDLDFKPLSERQSKKIKAKILS